MNTALSIIDAITPNTDIDYRQEMNVIHEIVAECEKEIAFMHQVHDFVYGDERHSMINRLLRLNHRPDDERTRFNRAWLDKVDLEWVKQNIWAEYWKKVTDMTNVLLIMPASRRDEWREQFIEGKQETIKTDRTGYQMKVKEFVGVPEFKAETVIPMMLNLLNDRHKYLSERVYGLFKALSPAHKTNKTNGFSERLIIADCISDFWRDSVSVNYRKEDYILNTRITTKAFHALKVNNSNTITKGIAHLPLLHTQRRTITKTTRTTLTKTQRLITSRRTKPHTPVESTTHPFHPQE